MARPSLENLFVERLRLVSQAAALKNSPAAVRAPARVEQVIANIRGAATANGLDPGVIAKCWREVVAEFIAFESKAFSRGKVAHSDLPLDELRARIDELDRNIIAELARQAPPDHRAALLDTLRAVLAAAQ